MLWGDLNQYKTLHAPQIQNIIYRQSIRTIQHFIIAIGWWQTFAQIYLLPNEPKKEWKVIFMAGRHKEDCCS